MGLREDIVRNGNEKAIVRMSAAGMSNHQIAGFYADQGQPQVTADVVRGTLVSYEPLSQKSVRNRDVNAAIAAYKASREGGIGALAPA